MIFFLCSFVCFFLRLALCRRERAGGLRPQAVAGGAGHAGPGVWALAGMTRTRDAPDLVMDGAREPRAGAKEPPFWTRL